MKVTRKLFGQTRRLPATAATPAELLRELRAWATSQGAQAEDADYPLDMAGDAGSVAAGKKRLMVHPAAPGAAQEDSSFSFACTGCGACCRSYSSTVQLEPHDLWRMALHKHQPTAATAGAAGTADLLLSSPAAVELSLGLHSTEALPPHQVQLLKGLQTQQGIAPILFLNPVKEHGGKSERCPFAVETTRKAAAADTGTSTADPALSCTFGPAGMPYACSLYPLGELWRVAVPGSDSERVWYSLDSNECEGTQAQGTAAPPPGRTVAQYRTDNQLQVREAASLWFRRMATAHACSGMEDAVAAAVSAAGSTAGWTAEAAALAHSPTTAAATGSALQLPPWPVQLAPRRLTTSAQRRAAASLLHLLNQQVAQVWYLPLRTTGDSSKLTSWPDVERAIEQGTAELHSRWRTWLSSKERSASNGGDTADRMR